MGKNAFFPEIQQNFGFGCMRLNVSPATTERPRPAWSAENARKSAPSICPSAPC